MPAINEVLQQGRYRVIQPLGRGEIDSVFLACDNASGATVVIKEFAASSQKTPLSDAPFAERAKIFTDIRHPSLTSVGEAFTEANHRYLATEAFDGDFLSDLLEENKRPFALRSVMRWADALLDALKYLHALAPPFIHGEIKPQNLALGTGDAVKLLCFPSNNEAVTMPYAPLEIIWSRLDPASQSVILKNYDEQSEKILEQPPDARSDLYSLGATLYHLLAARAPLDALERSIDILEGKPDPLPPLHAVNPQVPAEISDVLMKTLEIRRENRFSSAVILRQILRAALARVAEREALETKKREAAALEIKLAEQKREEEESAERERERAEQKRLADEAEEKRQNELIKQQLREAESRRLSAERRAAEAERRLSEIEAEKSSVETVAPPAAKPAEEIDPPREVPVPRAGDAERQVAPVELPSLFAEPPKENKIFRRMAAGGAVLLMLGGAGWAVSGWLGTKNAEPTQTPTTALHEKAPPAPLVETSTVPTPEPSPQAETLPVASSSPKSTLPAVVSPQTEPIKAPPAARRVRKQTAAEKAPPSPKKAVTVDDIINDN